MIRDFNKRRTCHSGLRPMLQHVVCIFRTVSHVINYDLPQARGRITYTESGVPRGLAPAAMRSAWLARSSLFSLPEIEELPGPPDFPSESISDDLLVEPRAPKFIKRARPEAGGKPPVTGIASAVEGRRRAGRHQRRKAEQTQTRRSERRRRTQAARPSPDDRSQGKSKRALRYRTNVKQRDVHPAAAAAWLPCCCSSVPLHVARAGRKVTCICRRARVPPVSACRHDDGNSTG